VTVRETRPGQWWKPARSWFLWTFSGDLASKGAVLATALIAVRVLDPLQFGQYVGLVAAAFLGVSLWDFGLSTVVTREVAGARLSGGSALRQAVRLRLWSAPVIPLTMALGVVVLSRGSNLTWASATIYAGFAFAAGTSMLFIAVLRGRLHFREAGLSLAIGRWFGAVSSLAVLVANPRDGALALLGGALIGGELVVIVLSAVDLRRNPEPSAPLNETRLTLREAAPFAANGLLATAYNRLDVIVVGALTSASQLALYAPASRIQDAMALVPFAIGAVALPMAAETLQSNGGERQIRHLTTQLLVLAFGISLPLTWVIFAIVPQLIESLLGPAYVGASTPTRILLWSVPLSALTAPLLAVLTALGRGGDTTKVFVTAFAVSMTMHATLDPWLGATGAAIASFSRDPAALAVAILLVYRAGLIGPRAGRRLELPVHGGTTS
jgi:O-antigen/teichoic acid export membrane protein